MTIEEIRNLPEYQDWLSEQIFVDVDDEHIRQLVEDDLTQGSSMETKEYTLWRTWQKLNRNYGDASGEVLKNIQKVKNKMWIPKKPDDYLKLEPEIIYVKQEFPIRRVNIWGNERIALFSNPDPLNIDWTMLGDFVSTGDPTAGSIGRKLRFLVRDKKTKKYLGILALASDYLDLTGRDTAIGWTRDARGKGNMIDHTAAGAVIVPTQPLGFSYVGGKLLSLLLLSEPVCQVWEQVYGKKLVGVTTTSLYGGNSSQYDGLKPHWEYYGLSAGSSVLRPTLDVTKKMKEWMQNKYPEKYWELDVAKRENGQPLIRYPEEKIRTFCYKELGFKPKLYKSNHQRRTYFSHLYDKSFEFLRSEITEKQLGEKQFVNSVETLTEQWRTEYASKRVKSLLKNDRFSYQTSYYDEVVGQPWDQASKLFLPQ